LEKPGSQETFLNKGYKKGPGKKKGPGLTWKTQVKAATKAAIKTIHKFPGQKNHPKTIAKNLALRALTQLKLQVGGHKRLPKGPTKGHPQGGQKRAKAGLTPKLPKNFQRPPLITKSPRERETTHNGVQSKAPARRKSKPPRKKISRPAL